MISPVWPLGPHSRRLQCAGIAWHVQLTGRGPALLLVHGTGASSHSFDALVPELAEHFTIVAPDLPGHALSEVPPGFQPSLPNIAHALSALLRELDVSPSVAVGHSAGAALVLRLALDREIAPRLLVGLAAALVPMSRISRMVLSQLAHTLARAPGLIAWWVSDTERMENILRSTGAVLDSRSVELYRLLLERPEHVAGVLSMMAHWDLAPLYRALPELSVPLLLLAGELDRAVPLAQLRAAAARIPTARLAVIEGTGHLLHEERPLTIARAILRARPQEPSS